MAIRSGGMNGASEIARSDACVATMRVSRKDEVCFLYRSK